MARYFDAEKVTGTLASMRRKCDTNDIDDFYNMLSCAFDVLPTADVVEVVRCDMCKWQRKYLLNSGHYWYECENGNEALGLDGEFCSDGVRRTDDGTDAG